MKRNIGLTLLGYFKSSFILWHAPRRGNTFAIGMVQHLHDSYLVLLSSTSHNGGTRSLPFLVFVPWCLNIEYHVFYPKGAKELSFHIRSLKSYSHCRNIFFSRILSIWQSMCGCPFRGGASRMEGPLRISPEEGSQGGQDVRKVVRRRCPRKTVGGKK